MPVESLTVEQGIVLTLKVPEELQLYGLYVYYVVHICDFGMLRVKQTLWHFSGRELVSIQ